IFQQIGVSFKAIGEIAAMRNGLLELPGVAPGENAGAARAAFRIRGEGVLEERSFFGHAIEVWRLDPIATVSAGVRAAVPIVENDKEDVRFRGIGGSGRAARETEERKEKGGNSHGRKGVLRG